MKISVSSKLVCNKFYFSGQQNIEDYLVEVKNKQPFQVLTNIQAKPPAKNEKRRVRLPKSYISQQVDQNQHQTQIDTQQIVQTACQEIEVEKDDTFQKITLCTSNKQNLLLKFQPEDDSQSQQESKTTGKASQLDKNQHEVPIVRNLKKQELADWSNSSDNSDLVVQVIEQYPVKQQTLQEQKKIEKIAGIKISQKQITQKTIFEKLNQHQKVQCLIRRDKKNFEGVTEYNVYYQQTLKHILTIKKEGMWKYCFYLRQKSSGQTFQYKRIATLQSNFLGNSYTLLKYKQKNSIATICYETNILGLSGPRKIHIYLPKMQVPYEYLNQCENEEMIEKFVSKTAKWNEEIKSYVLNFQGRVNQSSIKNFVITDKDESEDKFLLIFGKAGQDVYHLDIQSPFSLIQAVATAITSFQRKIVCD